ncbi:MAG: amino acid adenylation domain-containing protein, partial [Cyanobacteria bacterium J06632_3]
ILATLKLGAIYIPLDPTHPSLRLAHILKDSQATLILDSDASLKALELNVDIPILDIKNQAAEIDQHSTENLPVAINPQDLAYIIYTSGSTGKPKGVPIRHHSLVNLLTSMAKAPGIDSEDSFLAVTTVAFDIATLELLLPLTVGARLVIASSETVRDSDRIITQLENDEITIMQATPATWRMLLDSGWQGSQNLKIFCGGEALDFPLAQQLLPCCQELWNLYGPTETTIWSAAIKIDKEILSPGFVPIGSPIDNTQFYILDQHGQLVPQGTPGELHIGGAGLSTGYLNRPNLTAEKFVSLPTPKSLGFPALNPPYNLPTHHSLRLYKTGDLVRYHQNNTLEYLGRLDHQIKLRGFRIELGEIEAVLNNHDDVDQSLVMLRHDDNGEPQLVAYCKVWADVDVENPSNIRQHISSQLPTYMVPTAYVLLLDFPLTPNGKIDRKALPEPTINQSTAESRSPQTQTEQQLATIWAQTLNLSTIHATDNFFDLGGHSLLAARVVAQLQPTFGVSVPLRSLFESPTLSDFATAIDAAKQDDGFTPVQIIDREQPLPLSYAQQRQWVLSQLEPDNPFYNIPAALRLEENFSLPLLNQSLACLCQRHEELRTTFTAVNGEAQLSILPTVTPEISYVDAKENSLSESHIKDRLRAAARKPFNLETAPLLRVEVIQEKENLHYILLIVHHIIADATSVDVLMKEIVHVYSQLAAGEAVSLPPLLTGYIDYADWQRELDTTDQLAYWKEQLKDIPPLVSLPTDYPRPAIQQFEGGSYRFTLTPEQTTALKQLSSQHSATLFMLLMAAFQSLLHRYSRVEDIAVGTPISNRPQASLEGVLGMFVNTLVFRGDFSADLPFTRLLEQMRSTALSAYANQDVPFEQLLDVLNVPRNWSHSPLFQVMFVWQDNKSVGGQNRLNSGDSAPSWSPLPLDSNTTKVDLTLSMAAENSEAGEFLSGKFEYRQDLFKAATVETMADAFFTLLEAIVQAPDTLISQLPLVSEKQRLKLQQWNDTARDYSDEGCLHQLF